jgi:hypothetical protein
MAVSQLVLPHPKVCVRSAHAAKRECKYRLPNTQNLDVSDAYSENDERHVHVAMESVLSRGNTRYYAEFSIFFPL